MEMVPVMLHRSCVTESNGVVSWSF